MSGNEEHLDGRGWVKDVLPSLTRICPAVDL